MIDIILLISAIAILQTGGAYVRYMPFAGIMDAKAKRRLFYTDCLVLLFNMSWMALLVNQLSLNVFTYKCCLALGWIPFFLSMLFIFPIAKAAQIFVLGMQGIYMFALHGISAIFILLVFPDIPAENFLIEHLLVYDFFFAMTLPGAYRVFSPMLPSKRFMNEKSYSYYIAAIPMILVTAATPTSLLGELWSIDKLFVWLILTIFFIAFDRYVILEKKDFENLMNIQSANHLMEKSISFLQSYAQILQDNGKELSLFRHDLRHRILALHGLLQQGQTEEALALLESSHEDLERTATLLPESDHQCHHLYLFRKSERTLRPHQPQNIFPAKPSLHRKLARLRTCEPSRKCHPSLRCHAHRETHHRPHAPYEGKSDRTLRREPIRHAHPL